MDKILAITIGVVAVVGVGIGFTSDSSTETPTGGKKVKTPKSRRKKH